jgi:3-methyladenine DNA glycosylase AlkC
MAQHPAERFDAPNSIQTGVPLKTIISERLIDLIADSLKSVYPKFNTRRFNRYAKTGLVDLEFKERARHIADAMQAELPDNFDECAKLLIQSFGPELRVTKDYGLSPLFYLPHSELIGRHGASHFESGMHANYELTKRYTAEFSVRPYIVAHRENSLELLEQWTRDSNPHVRRLASEGSRSRLPWAMRLKEIDANPQLTLPLLERLKDDPDLYVRRSVANHLGDIGKANLPVLLETCQHWLKETKKMKDSEQAKRRRWIIRHALRHPAKKRERAALELRKLAE